MAEFGDDEGYDAEVSRRPSFVPSAPARRPSMASTAPAPNARRPAPDSEAPSSKFDGEDFLFHLYRGSELLQDNCVSEAKEELELALRVQPQDIEGQGLLGVVYFRLGLYPRAIEIYQEISRARPNEISPRVNLALCFLKTGQAQLAREALETVTTRVPDHVRAWGYLGLAYERLGDYLKAKTAFERAAQPHLVRRMQLLLEEQALFSGDSEPPPERAAVRAAAADAVRELETDEPGFSRASAVLATDGPQRPGLWRALEPGEDVPTPRRMRSSSLPGRFGPAVPVISDPQELHRAPSADPGQADAPGSLREARSAEPRVIPHRGSALLQVHESWAVRAAAVRALLAQGNSFTQTPLLRRMRGRELSDALGGAGTPWALLRGTGQILLAAAKERELFELELDGTPLYVRESCLVGFAGTAQHENGRLSSGGGELISMVQLTGTGSVLLESRSAPRALEVTENHKLALRASDVVGWIGRLLGHPLDVAAAPLGTPGFVAFSGSGSVLVDLG